MLLLTRRSLLWIGLLLIVSLPAVFPLLHSGFFVSDDGEWMIIRLSAFYQTLRDGQFPVRLLGRLNHGYGYPVANFLYPGYLYLGSFLHFLGFGYVNSIKVLLAGSLLTSYLFSFLWLKRYFAKNSALVGSLFYLYTPYHLYDVYTRGSVGEVLALAVVALFLWSLEKKSVTFSAFIYGFLILSHNSLALFFSPFLFIYVLITDRKLLWLFPLGLGLSCFFWLPALVERRYVVFDKVIVSDWQQYFIKDWQLLGKASIVVILLAVLLIFRKRKFISLAHFFAIIAIFSLFFALLESQFFWQILPLGKLVQFPWRFLSVVLVANAFLSSWLLTNLSRKISLLLSLFFISVLALGAHAKLTDIEHINKGENYYATNDSTTTVQDEYMPRWVREKPTNLPSEEAILLGNGEIKNVVATTNKVKLSIVASERVDVYVNRIYYPGWQAKIDGDEVTIQHENLKGIMHIAVPEGAREIELVFEETPLRKASNIISIVTLVVIALIYLYPRLRDIRGLH